MVLHWCPVFWPRQSYWGEFSLAGIEVEVKPPKIDAFPGRPAAIPPHFWGGESRSRLGKLVSRKSEQSSFPNHPGYLEVRDLIGNSTVVDLKRLPFQARGLVRQIFRGIKDVSDSSSSDDVKSLSYLEPGPTLVQLQLSPELESWKAAQHVIGNILPAKGAGLNQASDKVIEMRFPPVMTVHVPCNLIYILLSQHSHKSSNIHLTAKPHEDSIQFLPVQKLNNRTWALGPSPPSLAIRNSHHTEQVFIQRIS
ncbi:MAG: hypothetical protein Q9192_006974 [Flavoplaca navasiana]